MGFRQNAYARLWSLDDKGKYSVANVTVSKKNKETGEYVTEFGHRFVRLIGEAHNRAKTLNLPTSEEFTTGVHKGITIRILDCDITNSYNNTTKQSYWNPVIFNFEIPERDGSNTTSSEPTKAAKTKKVESKTVEPLIDDDDDLPF